MDDYAARSSRRAHIGKTVAPKVLPKWQRLTIFQRIAKLCPTVFEHYRHDLTELTASLERRLHASALLAQATEEDHQHVFQCLKKQQLLTDTPFAAALSVPYSYIQDSELYADWLALIVLCCCQLHILGNHDSAIVAALREIRLIASSPRHAPIFNKLPAALSARSLIDLGEQLEQLKHQLLEHDLEFNGIGYLSVVIRDAANHKKGITRNREPSIAFKDPEVLEVLKLDPVDDSGLKIEQLCISQKPIDGVPKDEPFKEQDKKLFRVWDPRSRQKALAYNRVQGKRLVEQLSTRQQSHRCSIDQASDWEIQHLISYCITGLEQQDHMAGWVLLSLSTGRDPEWLHQRTGPDFQRKHGSFLQNKKGYPCIKLPSCVPAGTQPEALNKILPQVNEHLILPLPIQLKAWIGQFNFLSSPPTANEVQPWLKPVNAAQNTRLTLGRIVRYLEHWHLNQGADRALIALIRGESYKSRPALSYTKFQRDWVRNQQDNYLKSIFAQAHQDPGLPEQNSSEPVLGSRLHMAPNILHHAFSHLASFVQQEETDYCSFHNHYVVYVWALLAFATGHRDVNAPMGQLNDYNPYQRTWWISDKERRHGLAARTVIIPATAARQVDLYLEHLRNLERRCRLLAPNITKRCQQALDSSGNLLFAITEHKDAKEPCDLTPSLLNTLLENRLAWARNWGRHHVRSALMQKEVSPELLDGWMGHEEIGEEALGRYSMLSIAQFRQVADALETLLNTHQVEALAGWTIR